MILNIFIISFIFSLACVAHSRCEDDINNLKEDAKLFFISFLFSSFFFAFMFYFFGFLFTKI